MFIKQHRQQKMNTKKEKGDVEKKKEELEEVEKKKNARAQLYQYMQI